MTTRSKYFPPQTKPAGGSPALRIACPVCHAVAGAFCSKYDKWQKATRTCRAHQRRREEEVRTR